MTVTIPTHRNYADLAMVRRQLDLTGDDPDRDTELQRHGEAVTAQIEAPVRMNSRNEPIGGLGVRWDGTDPGVKTALRAVLVGIDGWLRLPLPAWSVGELLIGETPQGVVTAGTPSPVRGWVTSATVARPFVEGTAHLSARWADDPGGNPPPDVVDFATWATAQRYRRVRSGASGQTGPEGYQTIVDNAWKTGGEWDRLFAAHGLPPFRVWAVWG